MVVISCGPTSSHSTKTWHEFKPNTPEQAKAVGKALGSLNQETALGWPAKVNALPGLGKEDAAVLVWECMPGEDFSTLPIHLQVGDTENTLQLFEGVLKFYFPHQNLIGRYYCEWQQVHE